MSAGAVLEEAAVAALSAIPRLGVYPGPPVQAVAPYAVVEAGPETDWGHKSADGRELRIAVTIRDEGELSARLRGLVAQAEGALAGIGGSLAGWQVVTMRYLRTRLVKEAKRAGGGELWAGVVEFRARMLRE